VALPPRRQEGNDGTGELVARGRVALSKRCSLWAHATCVRYYHSARVRTSRTIGERGAVLGLGDRGCGVALIAVSGAGW